MQVILQKLDNVGKGVQIIKIEFSMMEVVEPPLLSRNASMLQMRLHHPQIFHICGTMQHRCCCGLSFLQKILEVNVHHVQQDDQIC